MSDESEANHESTTTPRPKSGRRFWLWYVGIVLLIEGALVLVVLLQLGLLSPSNMPPGVENVTRTDTLVVNSQGDKYSPTDGRKDVVLVLELQGVSAEQLRKIPQDDIQVEADGERHPCPITHTQSGPTDKVFLVFIVPKVSQQMTLHLGKLAPISFQSSTTIVPQHKLPGLDEPLSLIVPFVLAFLFPVVAVIGAIIVAIWRRISRGRRTDRGAP